MAAIDARLVSPPLAERPKMIAALVGALALALSALPGTFDLSFAPNGGRIVAEPGALALDVQGAISGVLGRDDHSYHAHASASGFEAENQQHGLEARFEAEGVQLRAGTARLGLGLRAWGYGRGLSALAPAAPQANANRVDYRRGPLTEWYVNGPAGLQQGFTLASPPAIQADGPLTLALSFSGSLRPALEPSGDGLRLGGSSLRYRGLLAFDSTGRELPARLELHGRELLVRVEDEGARYPVTIDPFIQQAKLTASDGATSDQLGFSVAVFGDTVVVGAPFGDAAASSDDRGSAYVFVKPASGWANATQTAKLTASDGSAFDQFGASVAISVDTVVVGAPFDDIGANSNQGSAYVFVKPASGWASANETAKLTASDGAAGDRLGFSVAVSGDTAVAGAPFDNTNRGSAYVFVKPALGWVSANETAKLTASDASTFDQFGWSVATSGDTVVAGARLDDVGVNSNQGSAYTFLKLASGWATATESAKMIASDGAAEDLFGFAVAMSGDTVVVGAPFGDAVAISNQGSAYVFTAPTANLSVTKSVEPSSGFVGDDVTYTIVVSNAGPDEAQSVDMTDTVPAGIGVTSATTTQGTCSGTGPVVCALGTLAAGTSATVTIAASTTATGSLTNTASATSTTFDPDLADNSASATVLVSPLGHDVGIAGGGFRVDRRIDASREGYSTFTVNIKLKNYGRLVAETIGYAVLSGGPGDSLSAACAGTTAPVPPGRTVVVEGCTISYGGLGIRTATLIVTHDDGDGAIDEDLSNNTRSQDVTVIP